MKNKIDSEINFTLIFSYLPNNGPQIKLPANEAIMHDNQAENGCLHAKSLEASFLTLKTHKITWQTSNQGW